jgi:hypothetical protein
MTKAVPIQLDPSLGGLALAASGGYQVVYRFDTSATPGNKIVDGQVLVRLPGDEALCETALAVWPYLREPPAYRAVTFEQHTVYLVDREHGRVILIDRTGSHLELTVQFLKAGVELDQPVTRVMLDDRPLPETLTAIPLAPAREPRYLLALPGLGGERVVYVGANVGDEADESLMVHVGRPGSLRNAPLADSIRPGSHVATKVCPVLAGLLKQERPPVLHAEDGCMCIGTSDHMVYIPSPTAHRQAYPYYGDETAQLIQPSSRIIYDLASTSGLVEIFPGR